MRITDHPFDRNTIIHFRLVFSIFLLPVYVFALSQTSELSAKNSILLFFILHFLIYPASNLYNSYWDKDSRSIGGLRNPPPVSRKLYSASVILDIAGILLAFFIHPLLSLSLIPYIAASKLYSWHKSRLKKYAITGWFTVILFQGAYTFFLVSFFSGNNPDPEWFNLKNVLAMIISSLLIGAYYPLTQIYQHEEDSERGDMTISYKLGIRGTFVFTAILFILSLSLLYFYLQTYFSPQQFAILLMVLFPALIYFFYWAIKTFRDRTNADFTHAMKMTWISSICMTIGFLMLYLFNHQMGIL